VRCGGFLACAFSPKAPRTFSNQVAIGRCLRLTARSDRSYQVIKRWVDAHANLPRRARWHRESGCGSQEQRSGKRRPSFFGEGFLLAQSEIPTDKIKAYRNTQYRVAWDGDPFTLMINTRSEALSRLYATTGQTCGVFITAFNPFGQAQRDEANETRTAA
jgi:hypothetical protein